MPSQPFRRALLLGGSFIALTACSGPSGPNATVRIESSNPFEGAAEVAVSTNITVKFSAAMKAESVQVTSSPPVNLGTAAWSAGGTVLTLDPPADLVPDTTYQLRVSGQSQAGASLNAAPLNFRTAKADLTPPTLTASLPAQSATDVPTRLPEVRLTFSKPMNRAALEVNCPGTSAEALACSADLHALLGPPTWSDDDRQVSFKPTQALKAASVFTLRLAGRDHAGNPLPPTELQFTTAALPTLSRAQPADGATGLTGSPTLTLTFDHQMDAGSLQNSLTGTVNTATPLTVSGVALTSTASGFSYTFQMQPAAFLYGDVVRWNLSREATDQAGNPLKQAASGQFSMIRQLSLTLSADPSATGTVYRFCQGGLGGGCRNGVTGSTAAALLVGSQTDSDKTVYRSYLTFHLPVDTLRGATALTGATLVTRAVREALGDPFNPNNLGSMALERVDYGSGLDGDDFGSAPLNCGGEVCSLDFFSESEAFGSIDVLKFVIADLAEHALHADRTQFRLRFANTDSHNGTKQAYLYYDRQPTLIITYLTP